MQWHVLPLIIEDTANTKEGAVRQVNRALIGPTMGARVVPVGVALVFSTLRGMRMPWGSPTPRTNADGRWDP